MSTTNYTFFKDTRNSYILFDSEDNINNILMESIINTHIFDKTLLINGTQLVFPTTNIYNLYDLIHDNPNNSNLSSYSFLLKMIYHLSIQLQYLIETNKKCYIGYFPKDIYIVNNEHFFCINKNLLLDIQDHNILINNPFETQDFYYAPEILNIKELPCCIDYRCSYYSLGLMVLYIMNPHTFTNDHSDCIDFLNHSHIIHTDLFFLIRRCLQLDPSRRSILYM